jgi:peptidoglycan/xylan/chitin deacetylase (PgdA/CDA1 family)
MLGILSGLVGVAAGSLCGYAAMAPGSQLFGKTLAHGPDPNQIALTYDDGPNDPYTPQLLEVLERHGVKATFFLIGKFVRQKPELARAVASAGHVIGNHTETHPNLLFTGRSKLFQELAGCERALNEAVGAHATLFRPPYGFRTPSVLQFARRQGLSPVMWSVTCYDWRETTAGRIEQHAIRQIEAQKHRGKIVLLHDGGHEAMGANRSHTVEATDRLLRRYKDEGYAFVTVPEMMANSDSPATSSPV